MHTGASPEVTQLAEARFKQHANGNKSSPWQQGTKQWPGSYPAIQLIFAEQLTRIVSHRLLSQALSSVAAPSDYKGQTPRQ